MAIIAIFAVVAVAVVLMTATGGGSLLSMSGGNLSASDIAGYAENAGFDGPDLQVAVAVALAESSGNPSAVGDLTLGVSVGLWQINLKAHPQYTQAQLTDPQANANAAFQIYQAAGNQFTPWSTNNNGAYSAYIVQAQEGVNA